MDRKNWFDTNLGMLNNYAAADTACRSLKRADTGYMHSPQIDAVKRWKNKVWKWNKLDWKFLLMKHAVKGQGF
jgi:hypothetical protein